MITKMNKYSFLVYHKEYEAFLEKLRELGVVHVQEKESGIPEDDTLTQQMQLHKKLEGIKIELSKRNTDELSAARAKQSSGYEVAEAYEELSAKVESLNQQIVQIEKDYAFVEPWGQFDFSQINALSAQGIEVKFFSCQAAKYDAEWEADGNVFKIDSEGSTQYFVQVLTPGAKVIDADPVQLPQKSLSELSTEKSKLEEERTKLDAEIDQLAVDGAVLLDVAIGKSLNKVDFSKVLLGTESQAEDRLKVLEGWAPAEAEADLDTFLKAEGTFFEKRMPVQKEDVPVKLKNNAFSRLFEPIGDLYTLPKHNELDLTPFFAPFYMLFFGFCLGDAGYGLLILLGTLYGMSKAKPKVKPLFKLGFYLGLATTIMGIVGGTFFGIMFGVNPETGEPLQHISWLMQYQDWVLNTDNLMILALGLGYVQVIFGMVLKAVNLAKVYGFKNAIAQMGWIVVVAVAIPAYALGSQNMIDADMANMIALITGVAGLIPALFYNTPGKNIFLNFGTGLWDSYGMASGLLGDVLSYIRLFALGLSSAILGNVFNTLAMDLSPEKGIAKVIVMILILAFGHSLNLFMALLGSFVHPLRLTFVEFYKNAGFEGGGRKYQPFSKA